MTATAASWPVGTRTHTGDPELASMLFCPVCHRRLRWALAPAMWLCPDPDCLFPHGPEPDDLEVMKEQVRAYVTRLWAKDWDDEDGDG